MPRFGDWGNLVIIIPEAEYTRFSNFILERFYERAGLPLGANAASEATVRIVRMLGGGAGVVGTLDISREGLDFRPTSPALQSLFLSGIRPIHVDRRDLISASWSSFWDQLNPLRTLSNPVANSVPNVRIRTIGGTFLVQSPFESKQIAEAISRCIAGQLQ